MKQKRKIKEQNKQHVNFFSFLRYVENQFILEAKEERHKGGISSLCQRLRKSHISIGIGDAIYVQGATNLNT